MKGVTIILEGSLESDSVIPWIVHRGRLLDLSGWVQRTSKREIKMALTGAPILVDAMEVACSLGPGDVLVDSVRRAEYDFSENPKGFRHRY